MLVAKTQSLPVGRVLIMSGYIIEPHLQAAVQAQSMLKDGLIDLETALGSLRVISRDGLTIDQALSKMGWAQPVNQVTNKLGELLIEAGLVSRAQLDAALIQGESTKLPLGRVLVTNGWLSEQLLSSALNAQILVRDRRVTREQAISSLRAALERQVPIEQTLAETGVSLHLANETVRLGELLVMLDDPDAVEAFVTKGREGTRALPGKHGHLATDYAHVVVEIPDAPGALARLFADVDAAGVNVEDVVIEHDEAREVGFLSIAVTPDRADALERAMVSAGWTLRG